MTPSTAPPDPGTIALTTQAQTARAFRFLRLRLSRNVIRAVLFGSRLRFSMIVFCSVVFWTGLFGLFFEGFHFISIYVDLVNTIVEYLFSMFFLSLLVMLFFSTGILTYTGLFQSREAAYLLTTPATADQVFAYKFFEAIGFSSWGFLLLGSPMMVAYGITVQASRRIFTRSSFLMTSVRDGAGKRSERSWRSWWRTSSLKAEKDGLYARSLARLVVAGRRHGYLAADPDARRNDVERLAWRPAPEAGVKPEPDLAEPVDVRWPDRRGPRRLVDRVVLPESAGAPHSFLAYLVAAVVARDLYTRSGYAGRAGSSARTVRRSGWYGIDAVFHKPIFFIPRPIRLLILKDLRTFRRDPVFQWSQFLIFFGLLAFYFVNIRRLSYDVQSPYRGATW